MSSRPDTLFRLTDEAMTALSMHADRCPKDWLEPSTDFDALLRGLGQADYLETTNLAVRGNLNLTPVSEGPACRADLQALDFRRALGALSPARAGLDRNLFAWLNHFVLHGYAVWRWPLRRRGDRVKHVTTHWLSVRQGAKLGTTAQAGKLQHYNAAGRTYWIAETCLRLERASRHTLAAKDLLAHFSEYPEHYHALDRQVLRNPKVGAEFMKVLMERTPGLLRDGMDAWGRLINAYSGARLLDALEPPALRDVFEETADTVMSQERYVRRGHLRGVQPTRVLSLGAGTQSTVLALMAEQGYAGMPRPDLAVFADTGWEPPSVYRHLEWLEEQLSFPVHRVSGGNIRDDLLNGQSASGRHFMNIPAWVIGPQGQKSVLTRQCTSDYKTKPIHRFLREHLEIPNGHRAPKHMQVEMWLGISQDEAQRQKASRDEWITHRWPLIERGYSRAQLVGWFKERYPGRALPRSACIGCPYHSAAEWKRLRDQEPAAFDDAVFVDRALRELPHLRGSVKGAPFLHRERIPLGLADFSHASDIELEMREECEGLCGV